MSAFQFTKAICRRIPKSLVSLAQRLDSSVAVDFDLAVQQHENYIATLKSLKIDVTILESDEDLPDCVFVEDAAVVCGKTALLTRPGHESRRKETEAMKSCLESLGYSPVEMKEPACLDGGDVLFTGKEIFVGVSKRTNEEGISQLAAAFPDFPVHSVPVLDGLHLKSVVTMAGPNLIAIAQENSVEDVIKSKSQHSYQFLHLPDTPAANCVFANGFLLVRGRDEFPESRIVYDQINRRKIDVNNGELAKVDGCLTCCSVLLN